MGNASEVVREVGVNDFRVATKYHVARPVPRGRSVGHPCPRSGSSRVACAFLVYVLPPLPRCSGWAYSSLVSPAVSTFPHSRRHQIRDSCPRASDISSPPCLPRLLPAGAVAGGASHPLENAACHGARGKRSLIARRSKAPMTLPLLQALQPDRVSGWPARLQARRFALPAGVRLHWSDRRPQ